MSTKIFASYTEFLARRDKSENGVTQAFADNHLHWESMNSTNTGCWCCFLCADCANCVNCGHLSYKNFYVHGSKKAPTQKQKQKQLKIIRMVFNVYATGKNTQRYCGRLIVTDRNDGSLQTHNFYSVMSKTKESQYIGVSMDVMKFKGLRLSRLR